MSVMRSNGKLKLLLFREELTARLRGILPMRQALRPYQLPEAPASRTGAQQDGIAIFAIIKDEAPYLAEWIEFHLMLGVRHIFLYDNGSTDETPEVLAPYLRDGVVSLTPWRNFSGSLNPQRLAYAHGFANFGWPYRWIAPIDVDEFLFPARGASLDATLAELSHQPIVSLPWINFGPSGHRTKPNALVIESYTERAAFPPRADQYSLLRYKVLVDPRLVDIVGTHSFWLRDRGAVMMNDRGDEMPAHRHRQLSFASAEKLRLHHYFTRSHEEIERKVGKGRVSKAGDVNRKALDRRLRQFELAKAEDRTIARFLPELRNRLSKRFKTREQRYA